MAKLTPGSVTTILQTLVNCLVMFFFFQILFLEFFVGGSVSSPGSSFGESVCFLRTILTNYISFHTVYTMIMIYLFTI